MKKKKTHESENSLKPIVLVVAFVLICSAIYLFSSRGERHVEVYIPAVKQSSDQVRPTPGVFPLEVNKDGNPIFVSSTGYSLILPAQYHPKRLGEENLEDGKCQTSIFFSENSMGGVWGQVVPYANEPLKDLYFSSHPNQGYDFKYENALVAGKNSLLVEAGPIGESGSGTNIIIPFNENALIISVSYFGKDSPEVRSIMKNVQAKKLDISQCGK